MPGKSSKTEVVSLRVSVDLLATLRTRARAKDSTVAAVILDDIKQAQRVRADYASLADDYQELRRTFDQRIVESGLRLDAAQFRIAELEKHVTNAQEMAVAMASAPRGPPLPPGGRLDPSRHHPAGPVLASAVPPVAGEVAWSGLKTKGKKP
jgi:hypothetical protein